MGTDKPDIHYWQIVSKLLAAQDSILAAGEAIAMIDIAILKGLFQPKYVYDEYKAGLPLDEIRDRLTGGTLEKIVAYGSGGVPNEIAEERIRTAAMVERGLIATYHRSVYDRYMKQRRKDSEVIGKMQLKKLEQAIDF